LYVNATNNRVGIGTSSPSSQLEVSGSAGPLLAVKSTASGTPTAFVYSSTNGADFGSLTNHPARMYVNNVERMRIDTSGNLDMTSAGSGNIKLKSGAGIDFSATSGTGTSELFDDYEEGTWTPTSSTTTISMSGTNPSVYTKIGDTVSVIGFFNRNDASTTYDGNVIEIGGLPFSVKNYEYGIGGFDSYHGSTNRKHGMCYPYEDNLIRFRLYNVVSTNMLWGDLGNTRGIKFSFIYKTSS